MNRCDRSKAKRPDDCGYCGQLIVVGSEMVGVTCEACGCRVHLWKCTHPGDAMRATDLVRCKHCTALVAD
jgi:hypothetical protein